CRDHQMRVEPRAALVHHTVVANDHELRARAHSARGRGAETSKRVARMLFPIAVRLEDDRRGLRLRGEPGHDVIQQPRALLTREAAEIVAPKAGPRRMAAEE